jgi:PilZ domain
MRRDRRKNFRVEWNSPSTIYDVGRHLERPCIVSDFSNGGAKITGVRTKTIPDEFKLRISHSQGRARTCHVIWRTDDTLGVEFTDSSEPKRKPKVKGAREKMWQLIS